MSTYPEECPVAATLDAVGDRWTLLIVRDLLRGIVRFADLSRSLAPIAPTCSPTACAASRSSSCVERQASTERPLRAEYALTAAGRGLAPVIITLGRFGIDRLGRPTGLPGRACRLRRSRAADRLALPECGDEVRAGELELLPPAEILGARSVSARRRRDQRARRRPIRRRAPRARSRRVRGARDLELQLQRAVRLDVPDWPCGHDARAVRLPRARPAARAGTARRVARAGAAGSRRRPRSAAR